MLVLDLNELPQRQNQEELDEVTAISNQYCTSTVLYSTVLQYSTVVQLDRRPDRSWDRGTDRGGATSFGMPHGHGDGFVLKPKLQFHRKASHHHGVNGKILTIFL